MSAPTATVLHELTAVEQCAALHDRSVSAVELTAHYLDRIDRLGERLGAFVVTTPELALREAAEADRQFARGLHLHRSLQGLPIGFKDLQPIAGVPVTNGSAVLPAVTAGEDAAAVGLIRAAGAVMLGTTHAPELGIPCYTDTSVVGRPAVTPYDLGRSASGSSGGAAAAVAAGLLPVGHGSDGAGSIRTPAAVCGLVGVKPSRGAVSAAPSSSFFGFSTDGPLARTVEDAALLLDAMAVRKPRGLHEFAPPTYSSFLAASRRRPTRRLRVAVWADSGFGAVDPENIAAVDRIALLLEDLGHEVVDISNPAPWDADLVQAFFDYIGGVVSGLLAGLPSAHADALEDDTRWMKQRGDRLGAADFVRSTTALAAFADRFIGGLAPYDLAVSPVSAGPAVPLGSFHLGGSGDAPYRMLEWSAYTPVQNMSGLPAISIPSHVTAEGLPLGVQLTGTAIGSDPLLLGVAAQLEEQIGWAQRHPPVWGE
jgi:amidase